MLPKQILLANLLTDFPEMTIATDSVDPEMLQRPRRWDITFIKKLMITFGIDSPVFYYLTFGAPLWLLHASVEQFQTGWFQESVISAAVIVLVIRSCKPFFKSRPGKYLLAATLLVVALTMILPYTPVAELFGFRPLPLEFLGIIGLIMVLYMTAAEMAKKVFYRYNRR
jgi:Mg2+-importing ATPase